MRTVQVTVSLGAVHTYTTMVFPRQSDVLHLKAICVNISVSTIVDTYNLDC